MKRLRKLLFALLCACPCVFALCDVKVQDGALQPDAIGHVESGAVAVTGTLTSEVKPGAVQASIQPGALNATATFQQPLATISSPLTVDAPLSIRPGAVKLAIAPKAFSVNFENGLKVEPGAIVIQVDASLMGAEAAQSAKTAISAMTWLAIAGGVLLLVLGLGWFSHARSQAHMIAHLKALAVNRG